MLLSECKKNQVSENIKLAEQLFGAQVLFHHLFYKFDGDGATQQGSDFFFFFFCPSSPFVFASVLLT